MAALQRDKGGDGLPIIRLKGGAYLEWAMHPVARSTQDIDTFFTEEADRFEEFLRNALAKPLGNFSFVIKPRSGEIVVNLAAVNPRRHEIQVVFANKLLRKIVLEVSFAEGNMAELADEVPAPHLEPFGVPTPVETFVSISPEYQIAQKIHACTGPGREDRERDVLDILLLKRNVFDSGRHAEAPSQATRDRGVLVYEREEQLRAAFKWHEVMKGAAGGQPESAAVGRLLNLRSWSATR